MSVTAGLEVRVWVTEVWDAVSLSVAPDWTVERLKEAALREATGRRPNLARYVVKYKGALISDERRTLGEMGVPNRGPFIVLRRGRPPVR